MTRLPPIQARQMVKFLESLGFKQVRQHGSHIFFRHSDGRTATVPVHQGEDLGRGLTNKILHDIDVQRERLLDWLHKTKN
jgi:predicted RNA binding protein YcfA (HicA-like mRNA interferase family)